MKAQDLKNNFVFKNLFDDLNDPFPLSRNASRQLIENFGFEVFSNKFCLLLLSEDAFDRSKCIVNRNLRQMFCFQDIHLILAFNVTGASSRFISFFEMSTNFWFRCHHASRGANFYSEDFNVRNSTNGKPVQQFANSLCQIYDAVMPFHFFNRIYF